MSRRKRTIAEQALRDASVVLGRPSDDFDVTRLATLNVLLAVQQSELAKGRIIASDRIIDLLDRIAALRRECVPAADKPMIEVRIVEGIKRIEAASASVAAPRTLPPSPPAEATTSHAQPAAVPSEPKPKIMYRQDVASPFHAQVVNGISPPLKRFQSQLGGYPRSISPLSENPRKA